MKYAIIEISGRQFWVETGKYYDFNRISEKEGTPISINKILLVNDNGNTFIGTPYIENIKIEATIIKHLRGQKLIVYKMRPKKKTRKKQGHRQDLTRIFIEKIVII
jgi:large subunit ribosomal protein L21